MKQRCHRPEHPSYARYGGKGVTVCEEWLESPKAFIEWGITNGWKPGMHIDKDILCDAKGISPAIYSPDTCQFLKGSDNNKYTSQKPRKLTDSDIQRCAALRAEGWTLKQLSEEYQVTLQAIHYRLQKLN